MDTWYAVNKLMLYIDSLDKIYYCPLKTNRLVDDSFGKEKYKQDLRNWHKQWCAKRTERLKN